MFTGTVKLAQIDDYISPSQNCIQPKIMKMDQKQKATVTLNDCLACSGCITSAESVLIQQMSVDKFMQLGNSSINENMNIYHSTVYGIIAPQVLVSLSKYYQVQLQQCMHQVQAVLKKGLPNFKKLYLLTPGIQICHQLIMQQFMNRTKIKKNIPILCSQCPGWVCYSQKTLTSAVAELMSEVKSPQQIMAQIIRKMHLKQYKNTNIQNECKIVSFMPCYDKKLQAIRFQYQNTSNFITENKIQSQKSETIKIKQVDLTLATIEIVQIIKRINGENGLNMLDQIKQQEIYTKKQQNNRQKQQQKDEIKQFIQNRAISFVKDQQSNGYIQFILSRLSIYEFKKQEVKNSDFIQYTFTWQGKQSKMAKCYGFRNIQKIVQLVKKNKCPYLYVQVMACPGGCFGGGGQIRYENIKNKQIIAQFQQILTKYKTVTGQNNIDSSIFKLEQQKTYVKYKPIQKTLTQSVLNW